MAEDGGQRGFVDETVGDAQVSLVLGDLAGLDLTVSVVPYLSVFAAIADAVAGIRPGLPRRLVETVRSAVGDRGRKAFGPLSASASSMVPDCLIPITPRQDISTSEALERLFAVSPGDVARDVIAEFGADVSGPWRVAIDRPGEWIRACAESAVAVSRSLHPVWGDTRRLLEQERRRVELAVSRGGPLLVLQQLSPRLRVVGGRLIFRDVDGGVYDLGGRRLVLAPILSGPGMLMTNFDAVDVVWIGYPLPAVRGLFKSRGWVADGDRLTLLLGEQRRALLLYLTRPCGMSEAAAVISATAATATYHVQQLEGMGLVQRGRSGKEVTVSRTERGNELITLMGRDA